MRALWLLLLLGASVAMVMADEDASLEEFSDEELIEVAEREPEPVDEDEPEDNNEDEGEVAKHGMCRKYDEEEQNEKNRPNSFGIKMQDENEDADEDLDEYDDEGEDESDDDDEDEDRDEDENEKHDLEKRHHRRHRPHHKKRHHGRHRGHHKRHHGRHHGHRRHGKHGGRGKLGCRREFCRCKKRAGRDCREVIRCFMRMAGCVRRRMCHMRPHHRHHRAEIERKEEPQTTTNQPSTGHPHCPKQKCKNEFRECMNDTAKFDCGAKLKCIFKLKRCMRGRNRTQNWSDARINPFPTPKDSEELEDFQDEELVVVSEEDSVLDEDRHRNHTKNHTRHGFCHKEFKRCMNKTGEDCKKKFMCFTRMAHCVMCFHGRHRRGSWHGKSDIKRPQVVAQPWRKGLFKKSGALDRLNRPWTRDGFKKPWAFDRFKQNWRKGMNRWGPGRYNRPLPKGHFMKLANRRGRISGDWGRRAISWGRKVVSSYLKPWQRFLQHPSSRPRPTRPPFPPVKCKLELEGCLKKAGKECKPRFKCYFGFKKCLQQHKHHRRPAQGRY